MRDRTVFVLTCERDFGAKLLEATKEGHVWCVDSPANTPHAKASWSVPVDDACADLTTFTASDHETPLDMLERIFETTEDHQGESGMETTTLILLGVSRSPRLANFLQSFGFLLDEDLPFLGDECVRASRVFGPDELPVRD